MKGIIHKSAIIKYLQEETSVEILFGDVAMYSIHVSEDGKLLSSYNDEELWDTYSASRDVSEYETMDDVYNSETMDNDGFCRVIEILVEQLEADGFVVLG